MFQLHLLKKMFVCDLFPFFLAQSSKNPWNFLSDTSGLLIKSPFCEGPLWNTVSGSEVTWGVG